MGADQLWPRTQVGREATQSIGRRKGRVSSHAATATSGSYDHDSSPRTLLLPLPCALGGPPHCLTDHCPGEELPSSVKLREEK